MDNNNNNSPPRFSAAFFNLILLQHSHTYISSQTLQRKLGIFTYILDPRHYGPQSIPDLVVEEWKLQVDLKNQCRDRWIFQWLLINKATSSMLNPSLITIIGQYTDFYEYSLGSDYSCTPISTDDDDEDDNEDEDNQAAHKKQMDVDVHAC